MLSPAMRWQWLLLVPLAFASGAVEAGAAAALYGLIQLISDPARLASLPWAATIAGMLPWQGRKAVVLELTALVAVYYIGKSLLMVGAQYLRHKISYESSAELACAMLRRYLTAPYPFHFHRNSADLIRNCTTSVGVVLGGVLTAAISAVSELLTATALAVVLLIAAPAVALVTGGLLLAVAFLLLKGTQRAAARWGGQTHEMAMTMLQSLQQALGGIRELKVLGRERFFYEMYAEQQRQLLATGYLGITLGAIPTLVIETVFICGALLVLAMLTVLDTSGTPSMPLLALFSYSGFRMLQLANRLVVRINEIRSGAPAVNELHEDFLTLSGRDWVDDGSDRTLAEFRETIALDHVSYVYPGADGPAVRDVSLVVHRGESIGIVGPTGAGKSTLVDLIVGLLQPAAGRVTVDGADLTDRLASWKRKIGYVPQAIFLIDDSLRRNIALGIRDDAIDEGRVRTAMRIAQLERFIATLPDGLDTRVGERGIRLSGGERQRVGIARAIYHDPDVLVFDEATASLDVATEAELTQAIEALHGVKTLLVVAHRLSTVRRCDRLILLLEGQVAGTGTFEELSAHNLAFRNLAAAAD